MQKYNFDEEENATLASAPMSKETKRQKFREEMSEVLNENGKERDKKVRDMTAPIQSRWYRAPEVIITDTNYNKAVDIWSLGTILLEMILCSEVYQKKEMYK